MHFKTTSLEIPSICLFLFVLLYDASEATDCMTSILNLPHPKAGLIHFLFGLLCVPLQPGQAVPVWIPSGTDDIVHGRFCLECCLSQSGATLFPLPSLCWLKRRSSSFSGLVT